MKFRVDQDRCVGCRTCESICEDVFKINDDGFAEVIVDEVADDVKDAAIEAMEGCPTGAIEKEEN